MIGCNTHLLKHMKQAILVWSFRQNIFPGCYPEKTSKIGRAVDIVSAVCDTTTKPFPFREHFRTSRQNQSRQTCKRCLMIFAIERILGYCRKCLPFLHFRNLKQIFNQFYFLKKMSNLQVL